MNRRLSGLLSLIVAACLMTGGCIKMGPDFKKPELQFVQPERFQYRTKNAKAVVPEDRWWEVFGDPEINGLAKRVLKNNLDLQQAAAFHLFAERVEGFLLQFGIGGGDVDQVAGMRAGDRDAGLVDGSQELFDLFLCQFLGPPLIARLVEQLDGVAGGLQAAVHGVGETAADGFVCAELHL